MIERRDMDVTGKGYYTLNADYMPVEATSLIAWAEWFGIPENRLLRTTSAGRYDVISAFLGIDPDARVRGTTPKLFGTVIIDHNHKLIREEECATYEEAMIAHEALVKLCNEQ